MSYCEDDVQVLLNNFDHRKIPPVKLILNYLELKKAWLKHISCKSTFFVLFFRFSWFCSMFVFNNYSSFANFTNQAHSLMVYVVTRIKVIMDASWVNDMRLITKRFV